MGRRVIRTQYIYINNLYTIGITYHPSSSQSDSRKQNKKKIKKKTQIMNTISFTFSLCS